MGDFDNKEREEVFSKKVRAGKRTYFFDVKATRSNDYYVTVTESKKRLEDGVFIKHKIFLYKEDFEKFAAVKNETAEFVSGLKNFCTRSFSLETWMIAFAGPQLKKPNVPPAEVPTPGTEFVRSISEVFTPGETKNAMFMLL